MFVFVCLTSLSMKICKSIQYGQVFFVYICLILFTHLLVDGHLGCFHVLAIIKSAVIKHWGTPVSFNAGFLGVYAQQWDCWVIRQFYLQFFKASPYSSP